jgi:hypothetical protein
VRGEEMSKRRERLGSALESSKSVCGRKGTEEQCRLILALVLVLILSHNM